MSDNLELRQMLSDLYDPDIMLIDGMDDAIIGIATRPGLTALIYDRNKIVEILMDRDGMTEEEASEYVSFNIEGAYVGEKGPLVMEPLPEY